MIGIKRGGKRKKECIFEVTISISENSIPFGHSRLSASPYENYQTVKHLRETEFLDMQLDCRPLGCWSCRADGRRHCTNAC